MSDLFLPNFPPSLLVRLDRYIELLEELNPGYKWTRSTAMASLLARALSEIEGAEVRNSRRTGAADRRAEPRAPDRRQAPGERRGGRDRRKAPYPEMVDLVIEHLLREGRGEDETWRDREDPED
jgi:hypothetical protein